MRPRRLLVCFAAAVNLFVFAWNWFFSHWMPGHQFEREKAYIFIIGFTTLLSATALLLTNEVKPPAIQSDGDHQRPDSN